MAKKQVAKKTKAIAQPEVNIGLVGHVDHGKTTLTEKLSGKWTDTHSEEIKRGITIRLGYANTVLRKCTECEGPKAYTVLEKCPSCGSDTEPLRKISIVDAPGHETLMATMLSGTTLMDGAILMVAANEDCPQPQTKEHLMALQIAGLKNVLILQNKIDLVSQEEAMKNYKQIKDFLKGTEYENAPIVPISARQNINIGYLIQKIEEVITTPKRDKTKDPCMFIARSFDINKPGIEPDSLNGGILGGAVVQGTFKKGDKIEIVPGYKTEHANKTEWKSIKTEVTGLMTGAEEIKEAGPGGSIALSTNLDPSIVKSDALAGNIVGLEGKTPPIWHSLKLESHLLERVLGTKEDLDVEKKKKKEVLMLNVNATATVGVVTSVSGKTFTCTLKIPVAANVQDKVTISRRIGTRFRLIGYGEIKKQ